MNSEMPSKETGAKAQHNQKMQADQAKSRAIDLSVMRDK